MTYLDCLVVRAPSTTKTTATSTMTTRERDDVKPSKASLSSRAPTNSIKVNSTFNQPFSFLSFLFSLLDSTRPLVVVDRSNSGSQAFTQPFDEFTIRRRVWNGSGHQIEFPVSKLGTSFGRHGADGQRPSPRRSCLQEDQDGSDQNN